MTIVVEKNQAGQNVFFAHVGTWAKWSNYPNKPVVYILNVDYSKGVVRGLTLNEQGEFGIGLYLIEGLEDYAPTEEDLARWDRALATVGLRRA